MAAHDLDVIPNPGAVRDLPQLTALNSLPAPLATSTDTTPPAIGTVSPDPGEAPGSPGAFPDTYSAAKDVAIVIPVVDVTSSVLFVVMSAHYFTDDVASGTWETIYVGKPGVDGNAGFRAGYAGFSSVSGSGLPAVGFTFSVRKDGGWPGNQTLAMPLKIETKAIDTKGNVLS